jgi:uncharacterized protein
MSYGKFQDTVDYAQSCLDAETFAHTCRVLNYALQILETKKKADTSVVILAAILHDIGRETCSTANHAKAGSEKSAAYLLEKGYSEDFAKCVAECILTHSNCSEVPPQTLEAKILFDADKLDTTGAMGTARAIVQCIHEGIPVYSLGEDNLSLEGKKEDPASLIRKYRQKMKKLEKVFFTEKARKIAAKHQLIMNEYFEELIDEIESNYRKGKDLSQKYCN